MSALDGVHVPSCRQRLFLDRYNITVAVDQPPPGVHRENGHVQRRSDAQGQDP